MQKTFLPREWQGRSTPFQLGPENLSLLFLIALQNGLLLQNCFLTMYGEWLCRFVSEKDSQSLLGKKTQKAFGGSFRNTKLTENVHFSEKPSVHITLGGCLSERAFQVVLLMEGVVLPAPLGVSECLIV